MPDYSKPRWDVCGVVLWILMIGSTPWFCHAVANENYTNLDPTFSELRSAHPLTYPVYLQREDCLDPLNDAETEFNEELGHFLIIIDPDSDAPDEMLVHEYAHCMAWFEEHVDHNEAWGVAYSKCYRTVFE